MPVPRASAAPIALLGTIALSLGAAPAAAEVRTDVTPTSMRPVGESTMRAAVTPTTARTATSHTVRPGDTISAIAAAHGLRTADVLAWNDLTWKSVIHPGDVIRLSAGGSAAKTPAPKTTKTPSANRAAKAHRVARGDTLWAIAAKYSVTVGALRAANALKASSLIHPGQKLVIPGTGSPAAPKPAAPKPAGPTAAPSAAAGSKSYTVRRGDTMWAIARAHSLTLSAVLKANGLSGASIIYPGQKLRIPGAAAPASPASATPSTAGLDAEQIRNARIIVAVGRERGVPDKGIAIALATAMVESWIRNLDYGTYDSLGLFQQRPSTGWGTAAQVRDPRRAAAAFYGGPKDPNGSRTRGLLDIAGWQKLDFGEAAQAVQRSAHPGRYGTWEARAYGWLAALD